MVMTPSTTSSLRSSTCNAVRAPPRSTRARRCGSPDTVGLFSGKVDVMDKPLSVQKAVGRGARTGNNGRSGEERGVGFRDATQRDGHIAISFQRPRSAKGGLTEVHCLFEHCLEHRLQFAGRRTDYSQHVRRGRLLLQRLTKFIKQPCILDGDDRLGGQVLQKLDLLFGKRHYLLAEKNNCT